MVNLSYSLGDDCPYEVDISNCEQDSDSDEDNVITVWITPNQNYHSSGFIQPTQYTQPTQYIQTTRYTQPTQYYQVTQYLTQQPTITTYQSIQIGRRRRQLTRIPCRYTLSNGRCVRAFNIFGGQRIFKMSY